MHYNPQLGQSYATVAFFCAFLLLVCAHYVRKYSNRYAACVYIFAALSAATEAFYGLREYGTVAFSAGTSFFWTVAHVVFGFMCGLYWVIDAEFTMDSRISRSKTGMLLFLIPNYLSILLVLSTPLTHWYFNFDDGFYARGPLFFPISAINFSYYLFSGVRTLIKSFDKRNYVKRRRLHFLFAFTVTVFVIQIIQLASSKTLPYRALGTSAMLIIALLDGMQRRVGTDSFSKLNNRYSMEQHLESRFRAGGDFGIALLDVDLFKKINDAHGHDEGDKAILYVATAVIRSVPGSFFIARPGGDEFMVVGSSEGDFTALEERVNENLAAIAAENHCPYRITVSVGWCMRGDIDTIPDLLKKVDRLLYRRKAEKTKNGAR